MHYRNKNHYYPKTYQQISDNDWYPLMEHSRWIETDMLNETMEYVPIEHSKYVTRFTKVVPNLTR